jgi:hypothetical protein
MPTMMAMACYSLIDDLHAVTFFISAERLADASWAAITIDEAFDTLSRAVHAESGRHPGAGSWLRARDRQGTCRNK